MKRKSSMDYFKTREQIEALRRLSLEKREPQLQAELMKRILNGTVRSAITLENQYVYRARWNEGQLFSSIEELIYPPRECAKKGRFNYDNQSIFYAALCELGTIIELRPELNKLFTITQFKLTSKTSPLFFPVGIKADDGITDKFSPSIRMNKAQKVVVDFLNEEVTKRNVSGDDYDLSILIGQHFLDRPVPMGKGEFKNAGIAYSSVESKFLSNTTTRNLAMTPALFHEYYSFHKAYVYMLTREFDHYQLNPVNEAVEEGSVLTWAFNNNEMKKRISLGLLSHGGVCKNIMRTDESLHALHEC